MNELDLLKKRVDELETLLKALLGADGRAVDLTNAPIGNLILGTGCQVTMSNCPTGTVFHGDQDSLEAAEARLDDLMTQAEELEALIDDMEDRLEDIRDDLDKDE